MGLFPTAFSWYQPGYFEKLQGFHIKSFRLAGMDVLSLGWVIKKINGIIIERFKDEQS